MMLHAALRGSSPAAAAAAVAAPQLLRQLSFLGSHCDPGSHTGGSSSEGYGYGLIAAASAAVAAAAAVCSTLPSTPALADSAVDDSSCSTVPDAARRTRFTEWLSQHGGDTSAVAVQPCPDMASGLGLFATPSIKQHMSHRWLGRRLGALVLRGAGNQTVTAASFPLKLALTVEAAVSHPQLGSHFRELLELGVIDERTAVVLLLMIERARGEDSLYAPYLQLLPTRFDTPLFYSDDQLQELSGTTLAAATAARRAGLTRSWQQLQPAVQQMMQQVGVNHQPTYDDYLWATSIFWSRALALPITYSDVQQQQQQEGPGDSSSSSILRIKVLEGLVPGLDFANHSTQPKCWWEVEQVDEDLQAQPLEQPKLQQQGQDAVGPQHMVKLLANRACCPTAGEELTISYGDKSNEELLLLYGFAQPQNPHEVLMVLCPLPDPDDWDDVFTTRMQLLQAKGLRPQLFLSADHYAVATGQPLLVAPMAPPPDTSSNLTEEPTSSPAAARPRRHRSIVPEAARQILEVFVLDKRELATTLQQQQEQQQQQPQGLLPASAGSNDSSSVDPLQQQIEQLGLAMAVLTTLTRLLELKMIAMEGSDGTGPLEEDLKQLADADAAAAQQNQQGIGSSSEGQGGGSSGLPTWKRQCLLYRAGQKALVRSYITAARAELQDTLSELQALVEARGD